MSSCRRVVVVVVSSSLLVVVMVAVVAVVFAAAGSVAVVVVEKFCPSQAFVLVAQLPDRPSRPHVSACWRLAWLLRRRQVRATKE